MSEPHRRAIGGVGLSQSANILRFIFRIVRNGGSSRVWRYLHTCKRSMILGLTLKAAFGSGHRETETHSSCICL